MHLEDEAARLEQTKRFVQLYDGTDHDDDVSVMLDRLVGNRGRIGTPAAARIIMMMMMRHFVVIVVFEVETVLRLLS